MSARPSLNDTAEYNRITLSDDFKSQICSQIADSTESLPHWNNDNHRDRIQSAAEGASSDTANGTRGDAAKTTLPDTSDVATPLPKDSNPMDAAGEASDKGHPLTQIDTAREDGEDGKKGRPSGLRRLTTQIKRTISRSQK